MNATSSARVAAALARPQSRPCRPPRAALRRRPRALRRHRLPPHRAQRPAAARDQPGPLAQLRRRHALRHTARPRAPCLRPGRHAVRPGQQLRPALRLRRGELRAHHGQGPAAVPPRAGHHHEGRLGHVVGAVRLPRLAQVRARLARREPGAHGPRPRGHLLLAPLRPGHAARGDDGRAGHAPSSRARRATWASARTRAERTR